jgi:hypothetical protein
MATAKKTAESAEPDETAGPDEEVEVPFGDNPSETATLLLAAAEDMDLDPGVVKTTSEGTFVVPADLAKKAKVKPKEDSE